MSLDRVSRDMWKSFEKHRDRNLMMESARILWLGGVFKERAVLSRQAVSPAGNRWIGGLLRGLLDLPGHEVDILAHLPERLWPKGELFPGRVDDLDLDGFTRLVKYINFPGLRDPSLSRSYWSGANTYLRKKGAPDVLLTYNVYPFCKATAKRLKEGYQTPWVPVVADFSRVGPDWEIYRSETEGAAGHVFLSAWGFENAPVSNKFHLDGGIDRVAFQEDRLLPWEDPDGKRAILYTGLMTKYKGVDLILRAFQRLKGEKLELWLCGKMLRGHKDTKEIQGLIDQDSRIKFFGLVSEDKLVELSRRCSAFVNPRPENVEDHKMNFPSKILEYLKYGKPVISTLTEGLSRDYEPFLIAPERSGDEGMTIAMRKALETGETERKSYQQQLGRFLTRNRNWSSQAKRLAEWLGEIASKKSGSEN